MILKNISIQNFKSVENIDIPLQSYGFDNDQSSTMVLVGINESGKSNILEAIDVINHNFENFDFETTFCKISEEKVDTITVIFNISDIQLLKYLQLFFEKVNAPEEFKIAFFSSKKIEVYKRFFLSKKNGNGHYFKLWFDDKNIKWHHFAIDEEFDDKKIIYLQAAHTKQISIEDALTLLDKNQMLLSNKAFEKLFLK